MMMELMSCLMACGWTTSVLVWEVEHSQETIRTGKVKVFKMRLERIIKEKKEMAR